MAERGRGRPTDFVQEVKDKILIAIKKGAPYEIAANYAGICYDTLNNWKNKAEREKLPDYVDFFRDLKEAEAHTALVWMDKIDKAMNEGIWTAAAWKLERRHHKYFSTHAPLIEMDERIRKLEEEKRKDQDAEETSKA